MKSNNLTIEIHLAGRSACEKCGDWLQDIDVSAPHLQGAKFAARACMPCLKILIDKQTQLRTMYEDLRAKGATIETMNRAVRAELDGDCATEVN